MHIIIVIALIAILAALVGAGVFMLRRPDDDSADAPAQRRRMAQALAWRVGLSVALFALLLLAWSLGWIEPKGVPLAP